MIVFDLDGCLIDSAELIRCSYRDAGVEAPPDFLALGHHNWIEGDRNAVHARKNVAYLRRLASEPLSWLPAWCAAEMLCASGRELAVLTGAPRGAVEVLAARAPSWPFVVSRAGVSPAGKTAWLADRAGGVYVDDQCYVTMPDGWRLVHYVGQDADELCRQVT